MGLVDELARRKREMDAAVPPTSIPPQQLKQEQLPRQMRDPQYRNAWQPDTRLQDPRYQATLNMNDPNNNYIKPQALQPMVQDGSKAPTNSLFSNDEYRKALSQNPTLDFKPIKGFSHQTNQVLSGLRAINQQKLNRQHQQMLGNIYAQEQQNQTYRDITSMRADSRLEKNPLDEMKRRSEISAQIIGGLPFAKHLDEEQIKQIESEYIRSGRLPSGIKEDNNTLIGRQFSGGSKYKLIYPDETNATAPQKQMSAGVQAILDALKNLDQNTTADQNKTKKPTRWY